MGLQAVEDPLYWVDVLHLLVGQVRRGDLWRAVQFLIAPTSNKPK